MKKSGLFYVLPAIAVVLSVSFSACKKINEATELGGDLIPAVDNINTFEAFLTAETDNVLYNDSSKMNYYDDVAIGAITNDVEFGTTQANAYFNMAPLGFGSYPFKDSIVGIDSIVLSLSYRGSYGDTNSMLTVRVFEIDPAADFRDTISTRGLYPVSVSDFPTTGSELGSKSFELRSLNDSVKLVHRRLDTLRTNNILRIKFNPSGVTALDNKLIKDTSIFGATSTWRSAANLYKVFKGLAIKADMAGNALGYFSLSDVNKTALTFYYRSQQNGAIDTTSTSFIHGDQRTNTVVYGAQANVIKRTPGGGYAGMLATAGTNDPRVFIQGDPGSAGIIRIPALDTFKSKIIYRAELIAPRLTAQQTDIFTTPAALFLDRITSAPGDTAYSITDDLISMGENSTINFRIFGGLHMADSTYKWNITRHVQGVISHGEPNSRLRIYLPYQDQIFFDRTTKLTRTIQVLPFIATGRVILGGGSFVNPSRRIRLRVVYSNLQ